MVVPDHLGAIFLTKGSGVDDLRHERGHNWQLMMMGIGIYGYAVGIPSPLCLGKWDKAGNYYGAPWETMADILGGVQGRTHSKSEIANAWSYYVVSTLSSMKLSKSPAFLLAVEFSSNSSHL